MNKFYKLLDELKENGYNLYGENNSYTNIKNESTYHIGSLPATTELIENTPFDLVFNAIESNWTMYNKAYYEHGYNDFLYEGLHDLILHFDFKNNHISTLFKQMKKLGTKKDRDFINRLEYDYNIYMEDIINELRDLKENIINFRQVVA